MEQHQWKVAVGCGIYFGFRGGREHVSLEIRQIVTGHFEEGHEYEEYEYVGVGHMFDKTVILGPNTSYLRDTENLMRVPILDYDPTSEDFGGSMLRLVDKVKKSFTSDYAGRLYLKPNDNGKNFTKKVIGRNTFDKKMKLAADFLGIERNKFHGAHGYRHFFCTLLANDSSISVAEGMKAARHSSVSAHKGYQATDSVSEANKLKCLLGSLANKTGLENKTASSSGTSKTASCSSKSSSSSTKLQPSASTQHTNNQNSITENENEKPSLSEHNSTQEELDAFNEEAEEFKTDIQIAEARSKLSDLTNLAKPMSARQKEVRKMRLELNKKREELKKTMEDH